MLHLLLLQQVRTQPVQSAYAHLLAPIRRPLAIRSRSFSEALHHCSRFDCSQCSTARLSISSPLSSATYLQSDRYVIIHVDCTSVRLDCSWSSSARSPTSWPPSGQTVNSIRACQLSTSTAAGLATRLSTSSRSSSAPWRSKPDFPVKCCVYCCCSRCDYSRPSSALFFFFSRPLLGATCRSNMEYSGDHHKRSLYTLRQVGLRRVQQRAFVHFDPPCDAT